jgi:uncharacterized membrane protein HdeD (DUF308 family)
MSDEVNGIIDTKPGVKPPVFEDALNFFGWLFLSVGFLLGVFFIWVSFQIPKERQDFSWGLMIFGIFSIMLGLFLRLILEGIAEILRLLRGKK